MSFIGKWGYSTNEEWFTGVFDTREEAIEEGLSYGDSGIWVGQFRAPRSPESCIDAEDLLEKVLCQDDYCGYWADDCLAYTPEQGAELTDAVRRVFGEWLDRHGLRPTFGLVDNAERVEMDGTNP